MKKKDASFWSEIKTLDERLARDPDSFCFARLSEVYLKVGLVADALHTARHGVARHPGYLAGQRSLAMACNASDLRDECRDILETVTAAMPEDVEAQKLLASLYVAAGDTVSAVRTYTTVLDFRPDDVQSRKQLETIQQGDVTAPEAAKSWAPDMSEVAEEVVPEAVAVETAADEDEIFELSEADIVYDDELEVEDETLAVPVAEASEPEHHDPLSTQTLADLYVQQGFTAKALDIYRTILADDPGNIRLQEKVAQLELQESPASEPVAAETAAPVMEPSSVAPPVEETVSFTDTAEPFAVAAFDGMSAPLASQDLAPLARKEADNVVGTLDGWLENIRRIKACR